MQSRHGWGASVCGRPPWVEGPHVLSPRVARRGVKVGCPTHPQHQNQPSCYSIATVATVATVAACPYPCLPTVAAAPPTPVATAIRLAAVAAYPRHYGYCSRCRSWYDCLRLWSHPWLSTRVLWRLWGIASHGGFIFGVLLDRVLSGCCPCGFVSGRPFSFYFVVLQCLSLYFGYLQIYGVSSYSALWLWA